MKKSLIIPALFMVATSMMATDTKYFMGAGGEYSRISSKAVSSAAGTSATAEDNYSDIDLKVKAGVILNSTHRISVSHSKKGESDVNDTVILANYDYLIPAPMNKLFRSYVGVHVGKADYKTESIPTIGVINETGLAYGIQAGILYDIAKHVEFELGVLYTKFDLDKSFSGTYSGVDFEGNLHLEDSASIYSGLNYKF